MLHNYVPSGSGRDCFIFNDSLYKYGKTGNLHRANISKVDIQNEFWEKSDKKCENLVREPPKKFLEFGGKRKIIAPKDVSELNKDWKCKRETPISGYTGHRMGQTDVVGTSNTGSAIEQKSSLSMNLPSYKKMDVERIERRLQKLRGQYNMDPEFENLKNDVVAKQKPRMKNVIQPKYIAGYSGFVPRTATLQEPVKKE